MASLAFLVSSNIRTRFLYVVIIIAITYIVIADVLLAATWNRYVSPKFGYDEGNQCTQRTAPCATIARAVSVIGDEDATILLLAGDHIITQTINITTSLQIQSDGPGVRLVQSMKCGQQPNGTICAMFAIGNAIQSTQYAKKQVAFWGANGNLVVLPQYSFLSGELSCSTSGMRFAHVILSNIDFEGFQQQLISMSMNNASQCAESSFEWKDSSVRTAVLVTPSAAVSIQGFLQASMERVTFQRITFSNAPQAISSMFEGKLLSVANNAHVSLRQILIQESNNASVHLIGNTQIDIDGISFLSNVLYSGSLLVLVNQYLGTSSPSAVGPDNPHAAQIRGLLIERNSFAKQHRNLRTGSSNAASTTAIRFEGNGVRQGSSACIDGAAFRGNNLDSLIEAKHMRMLYIQNSSFNGKETTSGCVIAEGLSSLVVEGSSFAGCLNAGSSGGCLAVESLGSLLISKTEFYGCMATDEGGAVAIMATEAVEMDTVTFVDNTAASAGALYYLGKWGRIPTSILRMRSVVFRDNTATAGSGGAALLTNLGIVAKGTDCADALQSTYLEDNVVTNGNGGGIHAINCEWTDDRLQNSDGAKCIPALVFVDNTASTGHGGALLLQNEQPWSLYRSLLAISSNPYQFFSCSQNEAAAGGGCAFLIAGKDSAGPELLPRVLHSDGTDEASYGDIWATFPVSAQIVESFPTTIVPGQQVFGQLRLLDLFGQGVRGGASLVMLYLSGPKSKETNQTILMQRDQEYHDFSIVLLHSAIGSKVNLELVLPATPSSSQQQRIQLVTIQVGHCPIGYIANRDGTSCVFVISSAMVIVLVVLLSLSIVVFVSLLRRGQALRVIQGLRVPKDMIFAKQSLVFIEHLGDGAYGTVFKAQLRSSGEIVAVKCFNRGILRFPKELTMEYHSIQCFGDHPNLLKFKGVYYDTNKIGFVTDQFDHSVDQQLESGHQFTFEAVLRILRGVAQGLCRLHEVRHVHRDIKPSSVLIDGACEQVVVCDFGCCIAMSQCRTKGPGTLGFRAPEEQIEEGYQYAIDSYSFGMLIQCLLHQKKEQDLCGMARKGRTPTYLDVHDTLAVTKFTNREQDLSKHQKIRNQFNQILKLASECTSTDPKARPTMKQCQDKLFALMQQ